MNQITCLCHFHPHPLRHTHIRTPHFLLICLICFNQSDAQYIQLADLKQAIKFKLNF